MFDRSFHEIIIGDLEKFIGNGYDDVGEQEGVRTTGLGAVLGLLHLRGCHHLHGLGYLTRTFYALDSDSNVSGVGHLGN